MGEVFPGNNAISDILLLCCKKIQEKIKGKVWKTQNDEKVLVDILEFEQMLLEVKEEYGSGFTKNYRVMPEGEFVREIREALEQYTFIKYEEKERQVTVYPLAGKMYGRFPKDYAGGTKSEQQMAGE